MNFMDRISECMWSISHNAPLRTKMCTFLFWMEHCGIWNRCILGYVKLVYSCYLPEYRSRTLKSLSNTDHSILYRSRADSRLSPSQWETSLQSNAVSHWLGTNLVEGVPLFLQESQPAPRWLQLGMSTNKYCKNQITGSFTGTHFLVMF